MHRLKITLLVSSVLLTTHTALFAQDTFSIVAADSTTRAVGSAGASCVDLFGFPTLAVDFLGDLIPNKGAINTQASYLQANQINARSRMNAGNTPEQIIAWLSSNDVGNDPSVRQYGIVGFTGDQVSAAGFTGASCFDYKNHITGNQNGIYYSIQGNILSGQAVLDSMEARFLAEPGDLACKLMAALQGANTIGADTRCAPNGTSSLFAFVKVSEAGDAYNNPSFRLSVKTRNNAGIEPIDTLQVLFDAQKNCTISTVQQQLTANNLFVVYPNPGTDMLTLKSVGNPLSGAFFITNTLGVRVLEGPKTGAVTSIDTRSLPPGTYIVQVGAQMCRWLKV